MATSVESVAPITSSPRHSRRLWVSFAIGLVFAVAAGWVMAPVAVLPYFLGLYFYLLFGLLLGAMMYRLALPARPITRRSACWIGAVTALALWFSCLLSEYRYLPEGAFRSTRALIRLPLTQERKNAIQMAIRENVAAQLDKAAPPGGFVGYLRWAATNGRLQIPRVVDELFVTYRLRDAGWQWVVRVVLSLILCAGAICSQLYGLTSISKETDPSTVDGVACHPG